MAADGRTSGAGHGAKTAAVREQAILALLSEPTIAQAAARCRIGERTLRRWLTEDAAFQAEYEAARHATFQAALRRIPALTARAVDTLADLLGDRETPRRPAGRGAHRGRDWDAPVRRRDDPEEVGRPRSQSTEAVMRVLRRCGYRRARARRPCPIGRRVFADARRRAAPHEPAPRGRPLSHVTQRKANRIGRRVEIVEKIASSGATGDGCHR